MPPQVASSWAACHAASTSASSATLSPALRLGTGAHPRRPAQRPPAPARAAALTRALTPGKPVTFASVARVVVDVMPKPEILDPQGQAVAGAMSRLGFVGVRSVRQGKHFELDVDDGVDDETVQRIAATLLANPVIEDWAVSRS